MDNFSPEQATERSKETIAKYLSKYDEESREEICKLLAVDSNISLEQYRAFASLKVHLAEHEDLTSTEIAWAAESYYNNNFDRCRLDCNVTLEDGDTLHRIAPLYAEAYEIDNIQDGNALNDDGDDGYESDLADLYNGEITRETFESLHGNHNSYEMDEKYLAKELDNDLFGYSKTMSVIANELDNLSSTSAMLMSKALETMRTMSIEDISVFQKLLLLAREDYQLYTNGPSTMALKVINDAVAEEEYDSETTVDINEIEDNEIDEVVTNISEYKNDRMNAVIEVLEHEKYRADEYYEDHIKNSFARYRAERSEKEKMKKEQERQMKKSNSVNWTDETIPF